MGTSNTSTTGERAKHQRFLSDDGDKQKRILLLAKKLRKVSTEFAKTEEPRNIVPSGWMQLTPKQVQSEKEALDIKFNGYHIIVNAQTDIDLLKKSV